MLHSLHHLVYLSFATSVLEESELERVLVQARAFNTAHALTGVLLYSRDGSIMQVLEGARAEVQTVFARIARDKRHVNVVKLADGPIAERQFAQWSMGFQTVNPGAFAELQGYLDPAEGDVSMQAPAADERLYAVLANFLTENPIRF
jgi:Sensors of blue-light using FAD